jgi:hypothetical protein
MLAFYRCIHHDKRLLDTGRLAATLTSSELGINVDPISDLTTRRHFQQHGDVINAAGTKRLKRSGAHILPAELQRRSARGFQNFPFFTAPGIRRLYEATFEASRSRANLPSSNPWCWEVEAMNFLVSDSQASRHDQIRSFLTKEHAVIAVLLAAVDFEWTVRRVIDHRSSGESQPTEGRQISGLVGYARAWARAFKGGQAKRLEDVVGEWSAFNEAYQLRHDIIHGRKGSSGLNYVTPRVERMLAATAALAFYGKQNGADPYKRLRKRGALTGPTKREGKSAVSQAPA